MFRQDLAHLSIFEGFSTDQLDLLSSSLELQHYPKDGVIFEQGQLAEHLYILLDGEVVVRFKPYDGPPLTVAHVLPGGIFGWSAAMQREKYTSAALAMAESEAYRISGNRLRLLCEQNPGTGVILLDRLASVIAERLRNTHAEILNILTQGMDLDGKCWSKIQNDGI